MGTQAAPHDALRPGQVRAFHFDGRRGEKCRNGLQRGSPAAPFRQIPGAVGELRRFTDRAEHDLQQGQVAERVDLDEFHPRRSGRGGADP
jgi:hypothetical protein